MEGAHYFMNHNGEMDSRNNSLYIYIYQNIEENANKLAFYKFLYDGLARERKKIVENNEKLRLLCFLAGKI